MGIDKTKLGENDQLEHIIQCKLCKKRYEDPIILPCFKTICSKHVYFETNDSKFKCYFCKNDHKITEYPSNEEINKLLLISDNLINVESIHLGEQNKRAKLKCEALEQILNEAQVLSNDPNNFLFDYFGEIKAEIDQTREEFIQKIDQNYEKLINILKQREKNSKQIDPSKAQKLNETIKESKLKLIQWHFDLNKPDFSFAERWINLITEADYQIDKINYRINEFKTGLLKNSNYRFKTPDLNTISLGDIEINNEGQINESRLEGIVPFRIENFFEFQDKKAYRESIQWTVVKNVPWRVLSKIETTDNLDTCLSVYVQPEFSDEQLIYDPINSILKFRILKADCNQVFKETSILGHFEAENNFPSGIENFITIKEILNEFNGLYDKINDVVVLEVVVKIVEKENEKLDEKN